MEIEVKDRNFYHVKLLGEFPWYSIPEEYSGYMSSAHVSQVKVTSCGVVSGQARLIVFCCHVFRKIKSTSVSEKLLNFKLQPLLATLQ